ncbi:MAG: AAA family ATPase [Hyphomonas sp.]|nr:AAA family ATPase [Hyphomonas sp.]
MPDGFAPTALVGGPDLSVPQKDARVIVVGNEKGGAGKSTVSMHLCVSLMRMGKSVGVIDLDVRQRSLTRYLENRLRWMQSTGARLPMPEIVRVDASTERDLDRAEAEETNRLVSSLQRLKKSCDFIIIDSPGGDTFLSRSAHMHADTLITPLNDSFVDFDLLARTDSRGEKILGPSVYSEMVWNARQLRAQAGLKPIDWVVVRNRVGTQRMVNKEKMERAVAMLSERIGFRVAPGFSERVIFRELFPRGLTLLDLRDIGVSQLNISNVAARQELRDMMKALHLPGVEVEF